MMLALLFSFSLSRIRLRYVLTVFGLTPSSAAICLNATPEPNMHSTWYSRWESASCPGLVLPPPRPVMSMLASDGLTYDAPRATCRMASISWWRERSLLRYPAAPVPRMRRSEEHTSELQSRFDL